MQYRVIGKRTLKVDAQAKATGAARFAIDTYLPGMLWARVLRSPIPHARILSIDTARAKRLPGVKAVLTAADVPEARYGALVHDMGILARDKVRYIGEPVAAVAAADEETAEAALDLIDVEYEELPAVFDPLAALEPDAPIIHERLREYHTVFERTPKAMIGNVSYHASITQGDVDAAFASAAVVREDTFVTPKQHPAYLEPNSTVAAIDTDGRLVLYNTTQRPHVNQTIVAALLDLPMARIRVVPCSVGAGFGAKNRTLTEPLAAALALATGKPVRLTLSMEEELTASTTRHSTVITMKTAARKDGKLLASDIRLIFESGAYAPTPNAVWLASVTATGPYRIPNVRLEAFSVYTNKMMGGAFRGYGTPQVTFARESQLDMLAHDLGIDPVEIRLKNCFVAGDSLCTGQPLVSVNIEKAIRQSAEAMGWTTRRNEGQETPPNTTPRLPARAMGISCGFNPCGGFATSSIVRVLADGSAVVSTGAMDMGQGLRTVMGQIAAETLGLDVDDVSVVIGDTDKTSYDAGIFGDRGTHTGGMGVHRAALDAKTQILAMAAETLDVEMENLELHDKKISVRGFPDRFLTLQSVIGGGQYKRGGPVIGTASFNPETTAYDPVVVQGAASRFFSTYTFACSVAEVEVDAAGQIRVTRAVTANDCGTVINPDGAEGQIDGGLAIGLGYGLTEQLEIREGQVMNPSLLDYRIPTALDMPAADRIIVDSYDDNGPFGAKGVGNSSVDNMAPAIANAVFRAVGFRAMELPLTPDKVVRGMREVQ